MAGASRVWEVREWESLECELQCKVARIALVKSARAGAANFGRFDTHRHGRSSAGGLCYHLGGCADWSYLIVRKYPAYSTFIATSVCLAMLGNSAAETASENSEAERKGEIDSPRNLLFPYWTPPKWNCTVCRTRPEESRGPWKTAYPIGKLGFIPHPSSSG